MTPLVSIIVPCFNAAPWLAATLDSALGQTYPDTEVIVVDDGSTDDSLALARRFECARLRVIRQSNAGSAAARNTGLRAARGEFIQFLDADDLLSPEKIAAQVARLAVGPPETVATCAWGRFTGAPATAQFVDTAVFRDFDPKDFLILACSTGAMMHPAAWLVPRTVADRAGPWDETLSLNDDGEYFARIVLAAQGVVYSPTGASFYRSNLSGSLSRQRSPRALESVYRSVALVAAHLQRAEDSPRVQNALADYWQRLAFELYPAAPVLSRRAEGAAQALGGSGLPPPMGSGERWIARIVGWKLARRIRHLLP